MPGRRPVDKVCAHEASQGIMTAQAIPIPRSLEVFVHEDESDDPSVVAEVCRERARKHARNAYGMLYEPEQLTRRPARASVRDSTTAGHSISVLS